MKEYKYKINGMKFNVAVGDVDGDFVRVEVNGTPYKVELDDSQKSKIAPVAAPKIGRASCRERVFCTV